MENQSSSAKKWAPMIRNERELRLWNAVQEVVFAHHFDRKVAGLSLKREPTPKLHFKDVVARLEQSAPHVLHEWPDYAEGSEFDKTVRAVLRTFYEDLPRIPA